MGNQRVRRQQVAGVLRAPEGERALVTQHGVPEFQPTISTQEFIAQVSEAEEIEIRRGTTLFLEGNVTDDAGQPFDLTGCYMWHTAKKDIVDDDIDAIYQRTTDDGIDVYDAENGLYRVHVEPEHTADLLIDVLLIWDIQVMTPEDHVYIVTEGTLNVKRSITQAITRPV